MDRISDRERRIVIRWRTQGQLEALRATLDSAYRQDDAAPFNEVLKVGDGDFGDETPR